MNSLKCRVAVLKIASRCNINCSYCYMYNRGDTSYLNLPKFMTEEIYTATFKKAKDHCIKHRIETFVLVLHGGEPLLAGKKYIEKFCQTAIRELSPEVTPIFYIQTNGILIDNEWCGLLDKLNIRVGVSIDGLQHHHDQYRVDHKGKGTYGKTIHGLNKLLKKSDQSKKLIGVLTVINIESDPVELYHHFKQLGIRQFDVLLPDNNYDTPPPAPQFTTHSETNYADWLIKLFEEWFNDSTQERPDIRTFKTLLVNILGGHSPTDDLGVDDKELLVIETDGDIEAVDSLKICGERFTKSGANIRHNGFDDALATPLANLFNQSGKKLCKKCEACPIKSVCGGGYIPHRYSSNNGFDNPSIYCRDLFKFIVHIQNRVISSFPDDTQRELNVFPMSYETHKMEFEKKIEMKTTSDNSIVTYSELTAFRKGVDKTK